MGRERTLDGRAHDERAVEHAADAALDLQLGLEVGDVARGARCWRAAQDLGGEQPHEAAVELGAGDVAQLGLGLGRRTSGSGRSPAR